jgi:hypothetical protein
MHLYIHKGRHVVVSQTEKPEEGELQVSWVALAPTVTSVKKRGRRPDYKKPIPVADLAPVNQDDLSQTVNETATAVLAQVAPANTEESEG